MDDLIDKLRGIEISVVRANRALLGTTPVTSANELVRAAADRLEAQEALLREAMEALHQYISDMRYPPERDSRERRIAMAQTTLAKLRAHMGETE